MNASVWIANVFGWPAIQLSIASIAVRLPNKFFAQDTWLTTPRAWERDGGFYRDIFGIRKWKRILPDAAPWIGGMAKRGLFAHDEHQVRRFLEETRRSEIAHWCMIACLPLFLVWNPRCARLITSAYAIAANLPCIVAQRYNRAILTRLARNYSRMPNPL